MSPSNPEGTQISQAIEFAAGAAIYGTPMEGDPLDVRIAGLPGPGGLVPGMTLPRHRLRPPPPPAIFIGGHSQTSRRQATDLA